MNKDQVKGRVEEAKGKVKEVTVKILNDDEMELEGNIEKKIGKVKAGFGVLKGDIKNSKCSSFFITEVMILNNLL